MDATTGVRATGYTLPEVVAVLLVISVVLGLAAPPLSRIADVTAVVAAREEVAGALGLARVTAVGRGGSEALVSVSPPRVLVTAGADTVARVELAGITLDLGGRLSAVLRFDAVGIGRLASATIRLSRGSETRGLVVSSYGRVRRE